MDLPLPLSDELSAVQKLVGRRTRPLLWSIGLIAVVARLILLPLGHWWDITTFYNTFIDLGHNHSPYATLDTLSHIAQSSGWANAYEYYAYPPLAIYLYYPLARLFVLLHPAATYFFPVSSSTAMPSLPLDFYVLYKLPMWVADFALATLLARMSGTIRGFRDYLLNPYVLLISGAWTFDVVMVLALMCSIFWLHQGKFARAGAALAVATTVKFIPIILVPTCLIYLFKKRRTFKEMGVFLGVNIVATLALVAPFFSGTVAATAFQGGRTGGGMNWQQVWVLWQFFPTLPSLPTVQAAIGFFGTPTLAIMLLIAYWRVFTGALSLNRMIIMTLLAFFIGSKLVNEQYALLLFPFMFIEAELLGGVWRWFYRLFWVVPLLFAIMRVPIDRFLWPLYHTLFPGSASVISLTGDTGFEAPFIPWKHAVVDPIGMALLGLTFFVLSVVVFIWPAYRISLAGPPGGPRWRAPTRHEAWWTGHRGKAERGVAQAESSAAITSDSPNLQTQEGAIVSNHQKHAPSRAPKPRVSQLARRYIQRSFVPLILLAGLIVLVTVHFTSEMRTAQAQLNAARDLVTCAKGKLQTTFRRADGTGRPAIAYGGVPVLSYADWSSSITVNGVAQELWNNYHGYSVADGGCTVYSTTTGAGWQVIEIAQQVDDHTVQVSYSFTALSAQGSPPPQNVELDIVHANPVWYQPTVSSDTLTAQILPQGAKADQPAQPVGALSFSVSGPHLASQAAIALGAYHATAGPGTSQAWASSATTHYLLTSPTLDKLTLLGTEVITFSPVDQAGGTPVSAPVAPPTPNI